MYLKHSLVRFLCHTYPQKGDSESMWSFTFCHTFELTLHKDAIIILIKIYQWKFRNAPVAKTNMSILSFLSNVRLDHISKLHGHGRWDHMAKFQPMEYEWKCCMPPQPYAITLLSNSLPCSLSLSLEMTPKH